MTMKRYFDPEREAAGEGKIVLYDFAGELTIGIKRDGTLVEIDVDPEEFTIVAARWLAGEGVSE